MARGSIPPHLAPAVPADLRSRAEPRAADPRSTPASNLRSRAEPRDSTAALRRTCVLVAEDEDLVRELAMEVLNANGFDAIGARHGGEALSLFSQHSDEIDAVLLDLSMPVMDGAVVLGEMRKQKPSVRVVLTSGYDDTGLGEEYDGPVSFLQKPYRADKLIAELQAVLASGDN